MTFLNMNGSTSGEGSGRTESMGVSERIIPFIDLVFESQAVAVGSVTDTSGDGTDNQPRRVTVEVERSFHRQLPARISVTVVQGGLGQDVSLDVGKSYLLFLTNLQGSEAILLGGGDMGKWPRLKADWKYSQGHVQPLEEVAKVVEEIININSLDSNEDRTIAMERLFRRSDLGRIATLQYAHDSKYWPVKQGAEDEVSRSMAASFVALTTILCEGPLDYAVEAAMMQLLPDAPQTIADAYHVEALANSEIAIRDDALAALRTVAGEDFGFDAQASESERSAAVDRWHEWLESRRPELMRKEVPPLIKRLGHENTLERIIADLALRAISGTEVGFDGRGQEDARDEAVKRWDAWWREIESELSR